MVSSPSVFREEVLAVIRLSCKQRWWMRQERQEIIHAFVCHRSNRHHLVLLTFSTIALLHLAGKMVFSFSATIPERWKREPRICGLSGTGSSDVPAHLELN